MRFEFLRVMFFSTGAPYGIMFSLSNIGCKNIAGSFFGGGDYAGVMAVVDVNGDRVYRAWMLPAARLWLFWLVCPITGGPLPGSALKLEVSGASCGFVA